MAGNLSFGIMNVLSQASEQDTHRERLIKGRHFTKWFVLTYHGAVVGVILLFTLWHWRSKITHHRRIRGRRQLQGDAAKHTESRQQTSKYGSINNSSSSSSTVEGDATPPRLSKAFEPPAEHTALVDLKKTELHTSLYHSIWCRFRALWMYQPGPIPVLGIPLPSNSNTFLILVLLGLNIFYLLYNITFTFDLAFVFADRCSMVFVANLPWLYLLAAKNQPMKLLTGYSYENLNLLHRRLGELLCLLAVFHAAGMVLAWYSFLRPAGIGLAQFLTERIIVLGILALVCYEALYFTSLAKFREWWYEAFLGSHILLQIAGLVLVFFHHHGGRLYTAIAVGIFLADRLIFRLGMKTRSVRADLTVLKDGETVLVSADWPVLAQWSRLWTTLMGKSIYYGWKPTEHVFLTIPAMASKHVLQAHPFTIASAAPQQGQEHVWFNLIIRPQAGFTRDLVHYARHHSSAAIRLDGPYGSLHALEMLRDSDVSLIVAGGSGVAVAYPLIWTLLHDFEGDAEAAPKRRQVSLIWIIHEAFHVDWVGYERLEELKDRGLQVCIPAPTAKAGRPDVNVLVQEIIGGRTGKLDEENPKVGVVVSGPDEMNRTVRNTCAAMAGCGLDIHVAVEKYGW